MQIKKWIFVALTICFGTQLNYAQQFEMIHDDVVRTYVVYEPNNLDPNSDYPLVIGLHGAGSDGITMIGTAFLIPKAIEEKFIVASPDSLHYPLAWWNAGNGYEDITGGTDDLGFISALIDKMIEQYNVDATRVYIIAHSNGSMMAYRVAAQLSHKIAAIGVNSGQMVYEFEYCNPEYPVPIMHFHGLEDPICYYEGRVNEQVVIPPTESVIAFWSGINDCYSYPFTILDSNGILGRYWDSFDGNGDIILYTIEGWGHNWPRKGEPGIDATDLIWDFFEQHRRVIETDSNDWYVAPDGTFLGDGSEEYPWDLATALSQENIEPGDTVWLEGGTYTGPFIKDSWPAGTEHAPIIYRAMPDQRVALIASDPYKPVLTNQADYIWFCGIEVTGENVEQAELIKFCIEQDSVAGAKYINMVVHDFPTGTGFDIGSIGIELSGCISYNNGSGFYSLNSPNDVNEPTENLPWLRYYDCIAFNNLASGFFHNSDSQSLSNILHRGCVAYGNGLFPDFCLGSNQYDDNFVMQECFTYMPSDSLDNSIARWGTNQSPMNGRVTIENNIFAGGIRVPTIDVWEQVLFQGNTCYTANGFLLDIGAIGESDNCTFNENTYYHGSDEFLYKDGIHYETLEAWQAATGWDSNSIQIAGEPQTPWIYLRENKYEPHRAHLVIYNWTDANTVTVDVNNLWPADELEEGRQYQYRIVNIENIWGEPVAEDTLIDGTIEVPMQGEFACYLVTRKLEN